MIVLRLNKTAGHKDKWETKKQNKLNSKKKNIIIKTISLPGYYQELR